MKINIKRTTLICVFLTALLVGIFISRYTMAISFSWLILTIVLLPLAFGKPSTLFVYLCLAGLIIGWWRGGILQSQNLRYDDYYGKKVTIIGRSTEDSFYSYNSQLQFTIEGISIDGTKLPGKIQVRGFGEPMVYRHDVVEVTGKLYETRGGNKLVFHTLILMFWLGQKAR